MQRTAPVLDEDWTCLSTSDMHTQAVERSIQAMHSHLQEPLSLEDLAAAACLSPYHFHRVFRRLIGIPPGEFLSGLRLQEARHLLLSTSSRITDVCFDVGYTSMGTFTTRFTQLAGLSPRLLRQQAREFEFPSLKKADAETQGIHGYLPRRNILRGRVGAPEHFRGVIYLGLFPRPIPQGRPVRCTRLDAPGDYSLNDIPDGVYYLLAAAFPLAANYQAYFLPGEHLLVARAPAPLVVRAGHISGEANLALRPPRLTDPPLVMALPLL